MTLHISSIPLLLPLAGGSLHYGGIYSGGYGAAFCCQMKLWHLGRRSFLPAEASIEDKRGIYTHFFVMLELNVCVCVDGKELSLHAAFQWPFASIRDVP